MVYTTIKIKRGGCGVNYTDGNGVARYALKTPKDGAFECEIEQAKRLVALGVAEFVADEKGDTEAKEGVGVAKTGHLDAAQLESMDFNDLKKLAKDMGVNPEGKKKADYIAALVAVELEPGEEMDGDELPDLSVVDPE
jgi:hypothetical protein